MTDTADLYDTHGDRLQVAAPLFQDFGGAARFSGEIATVKVFEDNTRVRSMLETQGAGRVLVVDGGGVTALRARGRSDRGACRRQTAGPGLLSTAVSGIANNSANCLSASKRSPPAQPKA